MLFRSLFRYRLAIARLGERDLFHWWESSALTEEGRYALDRLFRQTSRWAAIQLAMEAAQARHEALVPPGVRITLFTLGREIEDTFDAWLSRVKMDNGAEVPELPSLPEAAHFSVRQALSALDVPIEEIKPKAVGDRAIHVAQIDAGELRTDAPRVVRILLGAYPRCEKDRFLAPYVTLR